MGLYSRIVHKAEIVPTDVADPETGGLLTLWCPTTVLGKPLSLTLEEAKAFGKNYQDQGLDGDALKVPTMDQLRALFDSQARGLLPSGFIQSSETYTLRKSGYVGVWGLEGETGKAGFSSANLKHQTVLVLS